MNYRWSAVLMLGTLMALPLGMVRADESGSQGMSDNDAHHWKHDEGHGHGDLGLTDDQKAKLKSIREAQEEALKPLWRKERDLSIKLRDQLADKKSDSDIQRTLADLKSGHESMQVEEKRFMSQREAVLTPTQQAKMMLMHMRMHRGEHGDRWEHEKMHRHDHEDSDNNDDDDDGGDGK